MQCECVFAQRKHFSGLQSEDGEARQVDGMFLKGGERGGSVIVERRQSLFFPLGRLRFHFFFVKETLLCDNHYLHLFLLTSTTTFLLLFLFYCFHHKLQFPAIEICQAARNCPALSFADAQGARGSHTYLLLLFFCFCLV